MTAKIGSFECDFLTAQPFGYEETETRSGLTARKWVVSGLVTPEVWLDLLDEYDTWRDLRILDEDTAVSGVVGTTISFSGSGPGNQTWTNIPCWFAKAPTGQQTGNSILASFEVVDAAEALEVFLKQGSDEEAEKPNLGTYSISGTVLKLLRPIEGHRNAVNVNLTAAGTHYVLGRFSPEEILDIEGTTNATGWLNINSWYKSTLVGGIAIGSFFPISAPQASAALKVVGGVKITEYTVTLQMVKIL